MKKNWSHATQITLNQTYGFVADHESRHNSYREEVESVPSEDTPLLRERFPPPGPSDQRDLLTSAVVTILLIVLALGVIIGIYLLIQQNDAGKCLPFLLLWVSENVIQHRPLPELATKFYHPWGYEDIIHPHPAAVQVLCISKCLCNIDLVNEIW